MKTHVVPPANRHFLPLYIQGSTFGLSLSLSLSLSHTHTHTHIFISVKTETTLLQPIVIPFRLAYLYASIIVQFENKAL